MSDEDRWRLGPGGGALGESAPPGTGQESGEPLDVPRTPRWGPSRVIGGIFLVLVTIMLAGSAAVLIDPGLETLRTTLALQTIVAGAFLAVAFFIAQPGAGAVAPAELGLRRPLHPAFKLAVLAYLAYIGAALVINVLLDPQQEDIARELGLGEGVLESVIAGFVIIVVASISEEVFFRGFVFAGLRRGAPFVVAALVSSAIWALMHFNPDNPEGSWGVVIQLTVLGVALAWLYERTGSIWPAIALHSFNNAIAFAVLAA